MEWVGGRRARAEFEELVSRQTPGLLSSAYLMCWDAAEAEDLVQETWTRVARQWPRVRAMDHPTGYVRRVLVNAVIEGSEPRTRRRRELLPERDAVDGPLERTPDRGAERALGAVEDQQQLRLALAGLSARQRAVLVLRYWEDRPEREVAELLGCSVGSVKSTASRALAKLRSALALQP